MSTALWICLGIVVVGAIVEFIMIVKARKIDREISQIVDKMIEEDRRRER